MTQHNKNLPMIFFPTERAAHTVPMVSSAKCILYSTEFRRAEQLLTGKEAGSLYNQWKMQAAVAECSSHFDNKPTLSSTTLHPQYRAYQTAENWSCKPYSERKGSGKNKTLAVQHPEKGEGFNVPTQASRTEDCYRTKQKQRSVSAQMTNCQQQTPILSGNGTLRIFQTSWSMDFPPGLISSFFLSPFLLLRSQQVVSFWVWS
ncbi:uncharacterized protein [Emydura macquarii macquarii]|uniref:uncharacterized protein n=1 Tax=Emydura macquarii macquarii TaxID=1129001 RepID=UPI00352B0F60